ncbi:MAG: methyltransferase, partial [Gemmatimonadales bacterium]
MSQTEAGKPRIGAMLEEHPGVRRAEVVVRQSGEGEKLIAYVVPDPGYLDGILPGDRDEAQRLKQWRTVYDWFEKGRDGDTGPAGLNNSIWNSSYTREAIPADQMREWCDLAVEGILALSPSTVLEIGCGTGALLLRIAPRCERYVGVDFSAASLRAVARQMQEQGGSRENVTL